MHPDALAARLACILLGYLFGSFLTAEVVARVVSGKARGSLAPATPAWLISWPNWARGPGC